VWRVNAAIVDAKRRTGVRGSVFVLGSESHAFYLQEGRAASVFHDGNHLHVAFLFENKSDAMSFQTALEKYVLQNPFLGLVNSALQLDPQLHRQVLVPGVELQRVSLRDYKTTDSDSPPWSLEAYAVSESQGTPATVDPERLHQCLEKTSNFCGVKLYKMHLKSKSRFPALRDEENNTLYRSWLFRQFIDGLNTESGLPGMVIRAEKVTQDGDVGGRARVNVLIELRSTDEATTVTRLFKDNSERISNLLYRSFVYVTDPVLFTECLTWKYEDTRQQWAAADAALAGDVDPADAPDADGSMEA
jgi:hypothetical protein